MDTSAVIMWVLVIVIIVGFIMTFRNLKGKKFYSWYEGLIVSIIGVAASCVVGVKTGTVENFLKL